MVTVAHFRKLVLEMHDVEEKSHFGQPDFRVENKIFADLGREGGRATLKLTPQTQAMRTLASVLDERTRPSRSAAPPAPAGSTSHLEQGSSPHAPNGTRMTPPNEHGHARHRQRRAAQ